MTRFLLAALVVVGVAVGVAVNAEPPEEGFVRQLREEERQWNRAFYLQMAVQCAAEWSSERLSEEANRLVNARLIESDAQEAVQQTPQIADEDGPLGKVEVEVLPGGVMVLGGRDEDIRRAREAIERQGSAKVGRFQIAPLEKGGGGYQFLVLDTTTGEVWGGTGDLKSKPYKLMTSVLEAQE